MARRFFENPDQLTFDFRPWYFKDPTAALKQFEPMIHKIVNSRVFNANCSDLCMDYDDVIQYGRQLVWEAIQQYDSRRGAKLSTFIHLKLDTKMANLARKIKTRTKTGTRNFSSFDTYGDEAMELERTPGLSTALSTGDELEENVTFSFQVEELRRDFNEQEALVFDLHFLKGLGLKELKQKLPQLSMAAVKEMVEDVREHLARRYSEA